MTNKWYSFDECFLDAIQNGSVNEIIELIKYLPEERKQYFRKLYKERRKKQEDLVPEKSGHP